MMRTMFRCGLAALMAGLCTAGAMAQYEYATIQGYWPLNESDGGFAADLSGNENTGILRDGSSLVGEPLNGPAWEIGSGPVIQGIPVNSIDLDGNNDILFANESPSLDFDKSKGAVALWVRPRQLYRQSLLKDSTGQAPGAGLEIQIHSTARIFFNPNRADGAGNNYFMTPLGSIVAGAWTHVVFTWDITAPPSGDRANPAKVRCYINGAAVQNDTSLAGDVDTLWNSPTDTGDWLFGYDPDMNNLRSFSGSFAEIAVFDAPLSSADAADLYANGIDVGNPSLVAAWMLEEGSGVAAADSTANANTLNFFELNYAQGNGPQFTSANLNGKPGYFDRALTFDGSDDLMTIPNSPSLSFDKSEGTMTMWVYFDGLGRRAVLGDTSNGIEWQTHSTTRLFINPNRREGTDQYFFTPLGSIVAGRWMHFAFVWDINATPSGDPAHPAKLKVYIDGVEQAHDFAFQGTDPDTNWNQPATTGDWVAGRNRALFDTVNPRWLDGQMSDFAIFSAALGPDDIATIYEEGVSAFVRTGSRAVGDLNADGCTDMSDFLILLDYWQLPYQGATLNINDFLNLLDNWQSGPNCPIEP